MKIIMQQFLDIVHIKICDIKGEKELKCDIDSYIIPNDGAKQPIFLRFLFCLFVFDYLLFDNKKIYMSTEYIVEL